MSDTTQVRSVARAIRLLYLLQEHGEQSLAELHRHTSLPKPTLLRLLHTLEDEKAAWRAQGDGLWRAAVQLRPTRILKPEHQRLIKVAMPKLESIRERLVWPSDLAVRIDHHMVLLETTRRSSGLAVNREAIGLLIDMTRSGVGRAYLANCSARERAQIVTRIARAERCDRQLLASNVERLREQVLDQGYATRDASFGGRNEPIDVFDDQLAAIAVPIVHGRRVLGCINVVWLKRVDNLQAVVSRHLALLLQTASDIARAWGQNAN